MNLLKVAVLPNYTEAKKSKKGFLNKEDLGKIWRNMLVFLTPAILLYLGQLALSLEAQTVLAWSSLIPNKTVVGAFEGYLISTFIDYLRKLNGGK